MLDLLLSFLIPIPIPETDLGYTYSGYNWAPASAPLRMDACEGSAEILRGVARDSTIRYGTGFTITGKRTATGVRMRFTLVDDHWQPLSTQEYDIAGSFAPGAPIRRTRRHGGGFVQHDVIHGARAVLCSPVAVSFSDGTRWTWAPPSSPYPQAAPGRPQLSPANIQPAPLNAGPPHAHAGPTAAPHPVAEPAPRTPSPAPSTVPSPKASPLVDFD